MQPVNTAPQIYIYILPSQRFHRPLKQRKTSTSTKYRHRPWTVLTQNLSKFLQRDISGWWTVWNSLHSQISFYGYIMLISDLYLNFEQWYFRDANTDSNYSDVNSLPSTSEISEINKREHCKNILWHIHPNQLLWNSRVHCILLHKDLTPTRKLLSRTYWPRWKICTTGRSKIHENCKLESL